MDDINEKILQCDYAIIHYETIKEELLEKAYFCQQCGRYIRKELGTELTFPEPVFEAGKKIIYDVTYWHCPYCGNPIRIYQKQCCVIDD